MERLESRIKHTGLQEGSLIWDDKDGILVASSLTKFYMPDIKGYSGVGCSKIHLRLYSIVMRAHKVS